MLKIGHRGAPGYPRRHENTLTSFERALRCGAKALEFDVRRIADGNLVVIHDRSLLRTAGCNVDVSRFTYKELDRFDVGVGEKVPLLGTVLDRFGSRKSFDMIECELHIELKEHGLAKDVVREVSRCNLNPRVLLSAFDTDDNDPDSDSSWAELSHYAAGYVPFALLATSAKLWRIGPAGLVNTALDLGAVAINLEKIALALMPWLVRSAHYRGLAVNVWTVNSRFGVKYFNMLGVDGIFSDMCWDTLV